MHYLSCTVLSLIRAKGLCLCVYTGTKFDTCSMQDQSFQHVRMIQYVRTYLCNSFSDIPLRRPQDKKSLNRSRPTCYDAFKYVTCPYIPTPVKYTISLSGMYSTYGRLYAYSLSQKECPKCLNKKRMAEFVVNFSEILHGISYGLYI